MSTWGAWGYWGIVAGLLVLLAIFFACMEILYSTRRGPGQGTPAPRQGGRNGLPPAVNTRPEVGQTKSVSSACLDFDQDQK